MASQKDSLELCEISAGYGKRAVTHDINFSVGPGELLVLAGPNGSGKTSILKTAAGLLPPFRGRVMIKGIELNRLKPRERAAHTAFLFQNRDSPWPFTVRETVAQGRYVRLGWLGAARTIDLDAVDSALEKAGLLNLSDRLITELSGGELQRVYIARSIAQGASFLLLDEPVNNLDPKFSYMILNLITELAREGRGIILSLHDLRLASRFASRILLLSLSGSILAMGSPEEVLTVENLGMLYDIPTGLAGDLIL